MRGMKVHLTKKVEVIIDSVDCDGDADKINSYIDTYKSQGFKVSWVHISSPEEIELRSQIKD